MQDMEGKKLKRYGCALFGTYVIIVKPKKKKLLYEPRIWFPLRIFEFKDIDESNGKDIRIYIYRFIQIGNYSFFIFIIIKKIRNNSIRLEAL